MLVLILFSPMLSFFSIFLFLCDVGSPLMCGSSQGLQQKVKLWLIHPIIMQVWIHFDCILFYVVTFLPSVCDVWSPFSSDNAPTPCSFMFMYYAIVIHFSNIWECLSMHDFVCYHFGVPNCERVNIDSGAHVGVPTGAWEAVHRPSKKMWNGD